MQPVGVHAPTGAGSAAWVAAGALGAAGLQQQGQAKAEGEDTHPESWGLHIIHTASAQVKQSQLVPLHLQGGLAQLPGGGGRGGGRGGRGGGRGRGGGERALGAPCKGQWGRAGASYA